MADPLEQELLAAERELVEGGGDAYRSRLADEAIVIVPGTALDKEATAQAIDASPGWDSASFEDVRLLHIDEHSAALSYRFDGTRGDDFRYVALMTSVYVRRGDDWKLLLHQQTPLES